MEFGDEKMIHKMKLNEEPFERIRRETKTIELRLYDDKRKLLEENHIIEFTNKSTLEKIRVKIIKLHLFSSFKDLYNHFDKKSLGYLENEIASYRDMEEYYSMEEQKKFGVIGIEMKLIK